MSQPASPSARIAGLVLSACLASAAELGPPQEVAFTAKHDGSRQAYLERLPQPFTAPPPHAVLIALHGHGSDRKQFATDGRAECRAARDAAAVRGMIFVAPDYRAPTSWMGPAAEADLVQLIGELKRRHQVGRIVLMGASMGGTSALIFTALHPDLVDGTVALNATANLVEYRGFADAIAASYGGTRESNPKEYRRRSPELAPQAFVRPLACTVGGTDTVVPPDSVRRLAQRLRRDRREVLLIDRPAGGHDTSYEDTAQALAFVLDRVLKGTP